MGIKFSLLMCVKVLLINYRNKFIRQTTVVILSINDDILFLVQKIGKRIRTRIWDKDTYVILSIEDERYSERKILNKESYKKIMNKKETSQTNYDKV